MNYNNEKITIMLQNNSIELITIISWNDCFAVHDDGMQGKVIGLFGSENEYREFINNLLKQEKKNIKSLFQVNTFWDDEYNAKIVIVPPAILASNCPSVIFRTFHKENIMKREFAMNENNVIPLSPERKAQGKQQLLEVSFGLSLLSLHCVYRRVCRD